MIFPIEPCVVVHGGGERNVFHSKRNERAKNGFITKQQSVLKPVNNKPHERQNHEWIFIFSGCHNYFYLFETTFQSNSGSTAKQTAQSNSKSLLLILFLLPLLSILKYWLRVCGGKTTTERQDGAM